LPAATSACPSTKCEFPVYDPSKSKEFATDASGSADLVIEVCQVNGSDLPMLSFNCVAAATDNFCEENKLGQGGFGLVYKVSIYILHVSEYNRS
jgi:aminoglycoside N3'-acetyltransferase